jgi:DNA repair protein RadC
MSLTAESQGATVSGPRDRALLGGFGALSDADLMALVIGHGVRGRPVMSLASELLDRIGGLEGLARAGPALLARVPGLGHAKALRLAASVEIGRRIRERAAGHRKVFAAPSAVAAAFAPRIGALDHEQMWVLSLDGRNRLRGARRVAQGGRHGLVVTAREILGIALADAATGFVLVHNHPSGSPTPSEADIEMTQAVSLAADIVGVPLLDHVVVTASGDYCSMLDDHIIEPPEAGGSRSAT